MDNDYTVGALGDLIASKMKISTHKNKSKNVESHFQTETSLNSLQKENSTKSKRKNINDSNERSIKKQKVHANTLNDMQNKMETIDKKMMIKVEKPQISTTESLLLLGISNQKKKKYKDIITNSDVKKEPVASEKPIKRQKKKKSKDIDINSKVVKVNDINKKAIKKQNKQKQTKQKSIDIENNSNVNMEFETSKEALKKQKKQKSKVIDINSKVVKEYDTNKKPIKKQKSIDIDNNSNVEMEYETPEDPIKKQKKKKSKDNSSKPKNKIKINKNPFSKSQDIKSSADYIEKESRTIFIGNVSVNVKMSAIKNAFKQFGDIESTRLRSVAVKNLDVPKRVSIMKKDFHPQRDTANIYVRFKTVEQAQSALSLNATQLEGHTIRVDMALNTGHKQNKKKGIFIGNLPYNIQEDEIWEFFKECGIISSVRIVRDNATGVSKGFGYVDFETKESVELAIQLQGKKVQNREIRIKRINTKTNTNKIFNKKPIPFKRIKPIGKSSQNFQGETMKQKSQIKKKKPTKTDLIRKKIAKQLKN